MELKYKTRGSANPQGKPKVYFSCHPFDFKTYFEMISDDILEIEDCSIWYDDKESEPENMELFLKDLLQMQLFVIPATRAFLMERNRAYDIEFAYAVNNHIPVLPLMQEKGLDTLFNERCGDLQFWIPLDDDSTSISYTEKLKKFLSSVLLGDELIKEVRAAFDAVIFLSYRKRDKEYAHQLMNLIHKNDFCKAVAIWYDEFLVAGENFNQAIEEALQDSNLFVMAVTPNLLHEGNYVMTTEYPMAVENKKPILPVIFMHTDYEGLAGKYKDIPRCVSAKDESALSEALRIYLHDYIPQNGEENPRKNFLIGLAYLSGIDVEVNKAFAVELITASAKAGLPEAMGKLAEMYTFGDGVAVNYHTAAEWYRSIVIKKEEDYYNNPQAGYSEYFSALSDLASANHLFCGDFDGAKDAYLKMEEVLESRQNHDCNEVELRCIIYSALGEIYVSQGDFLTAYEYLDKARCLESRPTDETFTELNKQCMLQVIYFDLYSVCQKMKKYSEAWEYLKTDLAIAQSIVAQTGEDEDKQLVAGIYGKMGYLHEIQNNISDAGSFYRKSLEISKELISHPGSSMYDWIDLSHCYEKVGTILKKEGDFAQAYQYYMNALSILEVAEEEAFITIYDRHSLGVIYMLLGMLMKEQGQFEQAKEYFEKSLPIYTELWEKAGFEQARGSLAILYYELGCIGSGNVQYLKTAKRLFYEDAVEMAYNGTNLSDALRSSKNTAVILKDIRRRILAIKMHEKQIKIISFFKKKR